MRHPPSRSPTPRLTSPSRSRREPARRHPPTTARRRGRHETARTCPADAADACSTVARAPTVPAVHPADADTGVRLSHRATTGGPAAYGTWADGTGPQRHRRWPRSATPKSTSRWTTTRRDPTPSGSTSDDLVTSTSRSRARSGALDDARRIGYRDSTPRARAGPAPRFEAVTSTSAGEAPSPPADDPRSGITDTPAPTHGRPQLSAPAPAPAAARAPATGPVGRRRPARPSRTTAPTR